MLAQDNNIVQVLRRWQFSFRRFQEHSGWSRNDTEQIEDARMLISYNTNLIALGVCVPPEKLAYDAFLDVFER